ncbi:MAG: tetratricopeptide repeat protein [Parvularculaceae bacterium]
MKLAGIWFVAVLAAAGCAAPSSTSQTKPVRDQVVTGGGAEIRSTIELRPTESPGAKCQNAAFLQLTDADALALCDAAVAADPTDGDAYYHRAFIRYLRRDYADAVSDYTRALELGVTRRDRALLNRGAAYESQREFRAACADYKAALELRPDWPKARQQFDECYWVYNE